MDRIEKALSRLSVFERKKIKQILSQLHSGSITHLDIKKLKGRSDIFRVRKGDMRIIYRMSRGGGIFVLAVEKRSENTYRNF
ncbi:hypothetical protein KGO95_04305 [Patescibacteria group bacterium]|nr:hypothetical protein [Patescibacteria group bacterium]